MGRLNGKHWESHLTTDSPPFSMSRPIHPPTIHRQWFPRHINGSPSSPIYFFRLNPTVIDPPAPSILDGLFFFFLFFKSKSTDGRRMETKNKCARLSLFWKVDGPSTHKIKMYTQTDTYLATLLIQSQQTVVAGSSVSGQFFSVNIHLFPSLSPFLS